MIMNIPRKIKETSGDAFQQDTKYQRGRLPVGYPDISSKPGTYKRYPSALKIGLDSPKHGGGMPIWEILKRRRSVRDWSDEPLAKSELSQLLWAAQGITDEPFGFRTAPSAGALYPIETYLVVNFVEGVDPGIYHYSVETHELDLLISGDFRVHVAHAALDQEIAYRANVVLIWTAIFARSKWKYKERAYRYVYLDCGHIAENVALAAVAMNLGSCQIGALYDDEVNALLGVDGREESAIYMTVVGRL